MGGTDDVELRSLAEKTEHLHPFPMFSDSRKLQSLPATSSSAEMRCQVGSWRKVTLPSVRSKDTDLLRTIQPFPPPLVVTR